MNFFQLKDDKCFVINELSGNELLENPSEYIFLLSYKERAIMQVYLRQLANGRDLNDACNKCDTEWHKPLILFGAVILSYPKYVCYNYVIHDSPYSYLRVAPKGRKPDPLIAADKLVVKILGEQEVSTQKMPKRGIWQWMKTKCASVFHVWTFVVRKCWR